MPHYLDPKADVVFKKIFGQHPHLLKSFLNALLPLPEEGFIESLEYLPSEQAPQIPAFKTTIVDVKCKDIQGRTFIVEMQIQWTTGFMQRMLFNASKAYIRQLLKGEEFHLLKPVYGLGLINSEFNPIPTEWYHHYKIVNVEKPQYEIKDLQLVFIELPKFKARTFADKKLQVLWLRFMSELNSETRQIPREWLEVPEIKEAVELAEEAAFTPGELEAYDRYWDAVSVERTLISGSYNSGLEQGIVIGEEKGIEKGIVIGEEKGIEKGIKIGESKQEAKAHAEKLIIARNLLNLGMEQHQIAKITGLSLVEIEALLPV